MWTISMCVSEIFFRHPFSDDFLDDQQIFRSQKCQTSKILSRKLKHPKFFFYSSRHLRFWNKSFQSRISAIELYIITLMKLAWKAFCFVFVYFRVLLRVHGGQPICWFSPSPSTVRQVSLVTGQILLLCIYIPTPFTESFDRLGRRIVYASKVPERESNSNYTNRVDPFPSTLSTRPTVLPTSRYALK